MPGSRRGQRSRPSAGSRLLQRRVSPVRCFACSCNLMCSTPDPGPVQSILSWQSSCSSCSRATRMRCGRTRSPQHPRRQPLQNLRPALPTRRHSQQKARRPGRPAKQRDCSRQTALQLSTAPDVQSRLPAQQTICQRLLFPPSRERSKPQRQPASQPQERPAQAGLDLHGSFL